MVFRWWWWWYWCILDVVLCAIFLWSCFVEPLKLDLLESIVLLNHTPSSSIEHFHSSCCGYLTVDIVQIQTYKFTFDFRPLDVCVFVIKIGLYCAESGSPHFSLSAMGFCLTFRTQIKGLSSEWGYKTYLSQSSGYSYTLHIRVVVRCIPSS